MDDPAASDTPPDDPSLPTWRRLLDEVVEMRRRQDMVEHLAVQLVRDAGATWEDIGEALGISRQAARERFGTPRQRR